jgi:hypothetical protein
VEDMSEDEALGNRDLVSNKSGEEESENDDDLESSSDEGGQAGIFVNPLNKVKKEEGEEESEEWSDDDAEDRGGAEEVDAAGEKKKRSLLHKRKRGEVGVAEDFYKNEDIEEVPADDIGTRREKGYDSEDS